MPRGNLSAHDFSRGGDSDSEDEHLASPALWPTFLLPHPEYSVLRYSSVCEKKLGVWQIGPSEVIQGMWILPKGRHLPCRSLQLVTGTPSTLSPYPSIPPTPLHESGSLCLLLMSLRVSFGGRIVSMCRKLAPSWL